MKHLTALFWKEWFEVRLFLFIGLFVFLGLPLIGGMQDRSFEIQASLWVFMLGGVLAIIIAVGIVVRDLNGRLEEFWRSRPVNTIHWLLVKYLIGLAVVLVTLCLPLIVEFLLNRNKTSLAYSPRLLLKWHPMFWMAVYSVSFAIASLLRRGAHAAMFSIAVMLLLYFLPSVLPPIQFLSIGQKMDDRISTGSAIGFFVGMIGLSAVALMISLAAVRNDWRIESDRKLIYWSIGGALLILFTSATFQVQSNLPLLQKLDNPRNEQMIAWTGSGTDGVFTHYYGDRRFFRRFHVSDSGIELGGLIEESLEFYLGESVWPPQHPDVAYAPSYGRQWGRGRFPELNVMTFNGDQMKVSKQSFPDQAAERWQHGMRLDVVNDRLYFVGLKLMTFDISDPAQPRLLSTEPITWPTAQSQGTSQPGYDDIGDALSVTQPLIQTIPALSPRQRLELVNPWSNRYVDGDTLIVNYRKHITSYRLEKLTDTVAVFRRVGRYDPTPVEQVFGYSNRRGAVGHGLFFESGNSGLLEGGTVTAYDITGDRPRPVGHFAFPDDHISGLRPLPDGRLLVVGFKHLYLLGPPPKH